LAAKHLLYFTADARQLYRWSGGGLVAEADFGAGDEGLAAFRERVARLRGAHFYVVADLSGEDFHEDHIPQLRGGDRDAIIQRRLAQRFRDARLAAAFSMGVTGGERRNERLLLASFTNAEQFAPWLDAITAAGITLAGVYSVPLLAPALATKLGARAGHALVVSLDQAGLRQSFIEEGRLRFARLERTAEVPAGELPAFVLSETSRLVQYLGTLRVLPKDGGPVQVFAVAPAGQSAAFEQVLVSDARLAFHTVGIEAAAKTLGIRRLLPQAQAEQLYLHLAIKNAPREQFARSEDRRSYFLWHLRRGIAGAGAAAIVLCAAFAGAKWLDVMSVRDQGATQRHEARAALAEYERITSGFPVTQTTTDNLRAAVTEFRSVAARTSWPADDFVHVSRVLDGFPQLELEKLEWRVDRESALGAAKPAPGAPAGAPPPPTPPGVPAAPGAGAPEAAGDYVRVLEVAGRVNATQRSDYRGITGQVQEFAQALRKDPAYRVVRMQLPFDVTSDSTLSGDIGEAESGEAPRFTVTIARRMR